MPDVASLATASPSPSPIAKAVRFQQPNSAPSPNDPEADGTKVNTKMADPISQPVMDADVKSGPGPAQKEPPPTPRLKRQRSDDDHPNVRAGGPVATPKKLCLRERVARLRTARVRRKQTERGLLKREEEAGGTTQAEAEVEREGEVFDGRLAGLVQELQETEAKRVKLEEELEAMLAEVEQLEEGSDGADAKRQARKK